MPEYVAEGETVLVTGGAGFIGSHLVEALAELAEVRVLDDLSIGRRAWLHQEAQLFEGDVRDRDLVNEAMRGVDVVFHLGAQVDVERSVEAPAASHDINVGGTLSVLDAARAEDAKVVVASSAAVYGRPPSVPIAEGSAKQPLSPYGLEKLAVDHYARLYHELYGVEAVPLRYFNVYGPRQGAGPYSGVVTVFIKQALRDEPLTVHGAGDQTRDFVHVDDVVRATLQAGSADVAGTALNVGTGAETSVLELAELIVKVVGSDAGITHAEPRPGDIDRSAADISAARDALGYAPSVSLHDGLERLVRWYEQQ